MAKLSLEDLQTLVATEVTAIKGTDPDYTVTTEQVTGLVEKIARTDVQTPKVNDTLAIFDRGLLPDGADIETAHLEMVASEDYDPDGQGALAPRYSSVLKSYSKALAGKDFPVSVRKGEFRKVLLGNGTLSLDQFIVKNTENMRNAKTLYKYEAKKQALKNIISLADVSDNNSTLLKALDLPNDVETSKAFVEAILNTVEDFMFASEAHTLVPTINSCASNDLVIIYKKGIKPALRTQLYASLQAPEYAEINIESVIVDDLGTDAGGGTNVIAMVVDKNIFALWDLEDYVDEQQNGKGSFKTWFNHYQGNICINPFVPVRIFHQN